jgi:hypothetical protein
MAWNPISEAAKSGKSKFSIDSILQLSSPPRSANCNRQTAVAAAAWSMTLSQQQKAVLALSQQQKNLKFILGAGQPILTLGSSKQQQQLNSMHHSKVLHAAIRAVSSAAYAQPPQNLVSLPQIDSAQRAESKEPTNMVLPFSGQRKCSESDGSSRQSSAGPSSDSSGDEGHDCEITSLFMPADAKRRSLQNRELSLKKSRTSFTKGQIHKLEVKFNEQKYLTKLDRTRLARELGLTEKHVKTWFQNRRTKWKKECSDVDWSKHKEMAATQMYHQYLENKEQS